jgi:hypothetical protein
MATKLTDLAALGTIPTDNDLLTVVDVNDTTGGAAGTSKKVTYANLMGSDSRLQFAKVSLSNADVLAMKYNDTPITLKAAEVGKIVMPVSLICVATHGGSNESSSDDLRIGWDAASSTTADYWGAGRDWMNGVSSGTISNCFGGASSSSASTIVTFSLTNKPFQIWCTDVFNGGWTMDVYFNYVMLDE